MTNRVLKLTVTALAVAFSSLPYSLGQPAADPLVEARNLIATGSFSSADSTLRAYLKDYPDSADGHFLLGYVLFREQKATESLAEFTAGARYRRPTAEEFETVASDYVLLEDFADADKWFSAASSERPKDDHLWYLLGRTKYMESLYEAAVSSFDQALLLHPRYIEAEDNRGLALRELNKLDQAQTAFQNAIDWQGERAVNAQPFLNLGTLLVEQDQVVKAIPLLHKAVTLAPQNPAVHEQLAAAYAAQNDLPKAESQLLIAVKLAPDTSALHYKLGVVYRKQKKMPQAQQEFDICTRLNSTHSSRNTPNPFQPLPSQPK